MIKYSGSAQTGNQNGSQEGPTSNWYLNGALCYTQQTSQLERVNKRERDCEVVLRATHSAEGGQ